MCAYPESPGRREPARAGGRSPESGPPASWTVGAGSATAHPAGVRSPAPVCWAPCLRRRRLQPLGRPGANLRVAKSTEDRVGGRIVCRTEGGLESWAVVFAWLRRRVVRFRELCRSGGWQPGLQLPAAGVVIDRPFLLTSSHPTKLLRMLARGSKRCIRDRIDDTICII